MTTQMIITRLTKPQLIGWQMGVRGFLTLDERYEIEPIANGVSIHHSVERRGIFGGLVGRMMRKGLRRTMRLDRKSVVWGKSVSGRVDLGGRRDIKKKTQ